MRLLGTRTIIALAQLALAPSKRPLSRFQTKQDVLKDVSIERQIMQGLESNRVVFDDKVVLGPDRRSWDAHDFENEVDDADEDFDFVPHEGCMDMLSYYLQFAINNPELNVQAIADVRKPGQKGDDTYSFFESVVTQFGSLSSVYEDVAVSEGIQMTVLKLLKIVIVCYIDDLTLLCRRRALQSCMSLVELHLALIGLEISHKKTVSHAIQRSVTILGVAYEISADHKSLSVRIPEEKVDELRTKIAVAECELGKRKLKIKTVRSVCGLFRHVASFSPAVRGCATLMDPWTVEGAFWENVASENKRAKLFGTLALLRQKLGEIGTLVLTKPLREKHLYTDASLEEPKEGDSGVHLGAALVDDKRCLVFSLTLSRGEIPDWVGKLTIGFLEMVAEDLAQRVFDGRLTDFHCVAHVDNQADVFSLVKGSSRSFAEHAVVLAAKKFLKRSCYYVWISTHRNLMADGQTRLEKLRRIMVEAERHFGKSVPIEVSADQIPWAEYRAVFEELDDLRLVAGGNRRKGPQSKKRKKN
jgi:hypothetical protein